MLSVKAFQTGDAKQLGFVIIERFEKSLTQKTRILRKCLPFSTLEVKTSRCNIQIKLSVFCWMASRTIESIR